MTKLLRWLALLTLLFAACVRRDGYVDCSLDRAEALLVLVEGIGDEAAARAAGPAIADWVARAALHAQRTAGFESISGSDYDDLVRARQPRTDALRRRLQHELGRLGEAPFLERFRPQLTSALGILPPALPE